MIADYDPMVGFDILSYEGTSSRVDNPDRFIEVKESAFRDVKFSISSNEVRVAREKGNNYHIVFIGDYEIGKEIGNCLVETITNPVVEFFNDERYNIDAKRFVIRNK